jgi:phage shock protein E
MWKQILGWVGLVTIGCGLVGCGAPRPEAGTQPDARALAQAGAKVIDVRTPGEFRSGHVAGAVNIPVDQIGERISEVTTNKNETLLLHCQSGGRSAAAKRDLEALGYKNVVNLGSLANAREVTGR